MFLIALFGCTPLVGDWSGEVDCDRFSMDVELSLEWDDNEYVGEGALDCTDAVGFDCEERFDIQVDAEGPFGEQDLEVDLDDCIAEGGGVMERVSCENPDHVEWDGGDTIIGDWGSCEFEVERD
jgi:hypothetical protein